MARTWDEAVSAPVRRGDQPSEIIPKIFLSGHPARFRKGGNIVAHPSRYLKDEFGIRFVVCCCAPQSSAPFCIEDTEKGIKTNFDSIDDFRQHLCTRLENDSILVAKMNIAAEDEISCDLSVYFSTAVDLIELVHCTLGMGVLIHCQMGVSRSATIIAAYLFSRFGGSPRNVDDTSSHSYVALNDVMQLLQARRPCVEPNPGFTMLLQKWEAQVLKAKSRNRSEMATPVE